MQSSSDKGRRGEESAARFLEQKGYRILARNFRSRTGEVDIICEAEKMLLFVEVKSWKSLPDEALESAVGPTKQKRIVQTARYFLHRNPLLQNRGVRFDILFVNRTAGTIRHIEGAFEAPCPE